MCLTAAQHRATEGRADLPQKEDEEGEKKDGGRKIGRNSADSSKDSGNTHISFSETEAAKLGLAEY